MSWDELTLLARRGNVRPADPLRRGCDGAWLPAASVAGLFAPAATEGPVATSAPAPNAVAVARRAARPSRPRARVRHSSPVRWWKPLVATVCLLVAGAGAYRFLQGRGMAAERDDVLRGYLLLNEQLRQARQQGLDARALPPFKMRLQRSLQVLRQRLPATPGDALGERLDSAGRILVELADLAASQPAAAEGQNYAAREQEFLRQVELARSDLR